MRDRNRIDRPGPLSRGVVDQRDAVPEHAVGEEGALPDRERRLGADSDQPGLDVLDAVLMLARQLLHRRPLLARVADILARVEADRALGRRLRTRWELGAARDADPGVHPGLGHAATLVPAIGRRARPRRPSRSPPRPARPPRAPNPWRDPRGV